MDLLFFDRLLLQYPGTALRWIFSKRKWNEVSREKPLVDISISLGLLLIIVLATWLIATGLR